MKFFSMKSFDWHISLCIVNELEKNDTKYANSSSTACRKRTSYICSFLNNFSGLVSLTEAQKLPFKNPLALS